MEDPKPSHATPSKLESIPFDVLVVLASGLSTADLLNLARTSSALRATLMSSSSSSIWRAARRHMGIPDGPDDLNEPLFAKILFGETCFVSETHLLQFLQYKCVLHLSYRLFSRYQLCEGKGDYRVLEQKLRLCEDCYYDK